MGKEREEALRYDRITHSHGDESVVRTTMKVNRNGKIWPISTTKPLHWSSPKFAQIIMPAITLVQTFIQIGSGVSFLRIPDFAPCRDESWLGYFLWRGFLRSRTAEAPARIWTQNTSKDAVLCKDVHFRAKSNERTRHQKADGQPAESTAGNEKQGRTKNKTRYSSENTVRGVSRETLAVSS